VAELVVGEPIRAVGGPIPATIEIYAVLNELAGSPEVVRLRLIRGKITLVHRRMWPALVRLSIDSPPVPLRRSTSSTRPQVHTQTVEVPFPAWFRQT
jgi:hypothetical protein